MIKAKTLSKHKIIIDGKQETCYQRHFNLQDGSDFDRQSTILNITILTGHLDKKISTLDTKISLLKQQTLEHLKAKNRGRAKQCLAQSKLYENALDMFYSKKGSLDQQLMMIKGMSDTKQVIGVLKECEKINKMLYQDTEGIEDVIELMRNQRDGVKERSELFSGGCEDDGGDVDEELEVMMREMKVEKGTEKNIEIHSKDTNQVEHATVKDSDFPSVRKDPSLNELLKDFK